MTGACGFPAPVKPAKLIILLKRIFHNQPPFPKNKESNDPQKRKAKKPERNSIQNGCPNKRWGNMFRKTSVAKLFSSTGKAQQKSVRLRPKMKIGRQRALPSGLPRLRGERQGSTLHPVLRGLRQRALPSGLPLGLTPQTPRCFASLPRLRAGRGILVLCCQLLLCRYARHKDSGHIGILLQNFKGWFGFFFGIITNRSLQRPPENQWQNDAINFPADVTALSRSQPYIFRLSCISTRYSL